jgi:hypothetical protein
MALTRGLDPAFAAALRSDVFHPVTLVDLDWPAGRIRAHSGAGVIVWGGHDWMGVGDFGSITTPAETTGAAANRATLTLVGLPADVLGEALGTARNRPATIYAGATTSAGGAVLVGAPVDVFAGYVDATRFVLEREGAGVTHGVQVDLGSGPSARAAATVHHSAEDQAAKFPGDTAGRWLINSERRQAAMRWPET